MSRIIHTNNGFFESPFFPSRMLGWALARRLQLRVQLPIDPLASELGGGTAFPFTLRLRRTVDASSLRD